MPLNAPGGRSANSSLTGAAVRGNTSWTLVEALEARGVRLLAEGSPAELRPEPRSVTYSSPELGRTLPAIG